MFCCAKSASSRAYGLGRHLVRCQDITPYNLQSNWGHDSTGHTRFGRVQKSFMNQTNKQWFVLLLAPPPFLYITHIPKNAIKIPTHLHLTTPTVTNPLKQAWPFQPAMQIVTFVERVTFVEVLRRKPQVFTNQRGKKKRPNTKRSFKKRQGIHEKNIGERKS